MIVGVFARADHPSGYGMPQYEGEPGRRAHGYCVALVRCADADELERVKARLARAGLEEPFGHTYEWYGGRMDCIAALDCDGDIDLFRSDGRVRVSIGDNRFVGVYEASEILAD